MVRIGAADEKTVIAIFETNDPDEFIRIFNDPVTMDAMSDDKVTGGVEMFLIDETFNISGLLGVRAAMATFMPSRANNRAQLAHQLAHHTSHISLFL